MKKTHAEKLLDLLHDRQWHSNVELVGAYGVSRWAIRQIKCGLTWRHT